MKTPLQDMVDSVIREAEQRVKTASAEPERQCSVCGVSIDSGIFCSDHESIKTASAQGVDLDYVEKLAGAVSYICEHLDGVGVAKISPFIAGKVKSAKAIIPSKAPATKMAGATRDQLKAAILEKLGSGLDSPPSISQTTTSGPPGVSASGEGPKAPTSGGYGLVSSVDKAQDYTKGDAKKLVKSDLAKVLSHPAFSDPVLKEKLQNTSKAGVKMAEVRTALSKIAGSPCTCDGVNVCARCRVSSRVQG